MEKIIDIVKPSGEHDRLAPCPFCGNVEIVYMQYEHAAGPRWMVFCTGCTAEIDPGYCQNIHQIRERWNRRTTK